MHQGRGVCCLSRPRPAGVCAASVGRQVCLRPHRAAFPRPAQAATSCMPSTLERLQSATGGSSGWGSHPSFRCSLSRRLTPRLPASGRGSSKRASASMRLRCAAALPWQICTCPVLLLLCVQVADCIKLGAHPSVLSGRAQTAWVVCTSCERLALLPLPYPGPQFPLFRRLMWYAAEHALHR